MAEYDYEKYDYRKIVQQLRDGHLYNTTFLSVSQCEPTIPRKRAEH